MAFRDSSAFVADPKALHEQALSDGYLYLPKLLESAKVAALRATVLAACARLEFLAPGSAPEEAKARPGIRLCAYDDPRYHAFLAEVLVSAPFIALREDSNLLSVLEAVVGGAVKQRQADICRLFSPDAPELTTVPHQDHHYLPGTCRGWTAWVPLGDCPRALGPIAVLPGSHLGGPRRHVGESEIKQVAELDPAEAWASGDLALGDVVFIHCLTLHRALPNRSEGHLRLSADYRFLPLE